MGTPAVLGRLTNIKDPACHIDFKRRSYPSVLLFLVEVIRRLVVDECGCIVGCIGATHGPTSLSIINTMRRALTRHGRGYGTSYIPDSTIARLSEWS